MLRLPFIQVVGLLAAALLATGCHADEAAVPPVDPGASACPTAVDTLDVPAIHTPRWAFEPWISKDISSTDDTYAFVKGFRDRDIPVGVVVLDSPWETNYNTFVPDPVRYHDFAKLVADLHADHVRVVPWITPLVNYTSFDFEPGATAYDGGAPGYDTALACGFFVNGADVTTWWKGRGGAIDYFNPAAVAWWHREQDKVLDLGIDGFKCDFGDSYVRTDPVQTAAGPKPHQEWSEAYYRDFFAYGVQKRGREDFVTMVRPWDESYEFHGRFFARKEHAPVTWVGDNRRDYVGLADALDETFVSANAGYVVIGSDIGGYLDLDDKNIIGGAHFPFDTLVFARWTAAFALTPFMELHGRANLSPWTVPDHVDETVALYRYWSKLHHELVPFFYSLAEEAYAAGKPMLFPQGDAATWPGDYRFLLGEALLVAPMLDAQGVRDVALPAGARWYDWWDAARDPIEGGRTLTAYDATDRARMPLFVREGAIIAAEVDDQVDLAGAGATGLGDANARGALTLLVYPGQQASSFTVHEADGTKLSVQASQPTTGAKLQLGASTRAVILRVRADAMPLQVLVAGAPIDEAPDLAALAAAGTGWVRDAKARTVWIRLGAGGSREVVLDGKV